jgi:DNA-binding MarR family transcriptional regulator
VRKLRTGHFRILLVLRRNGAPWVPVLQDIPRIAELAGIDERRVQRVLDDLEGWGLVRRTRTGVGHDDRVSLVLAIPQVLNPETIRMGRPTGQDRFLKALFKALRRSGMIGILRSSELRVYLALASRTDRNRRCWPGRATLAQDTGLSERTVQRALARLEKLGLVRRIAGGQGRGHHTVFEVLLAAGPRGAKETVGSGRPAAAMNKVLEGASDAPSDG